jgi:hypothetical protein
MQTLQHIPLWVFVLFIGLIALGLQQTRTRHIRRRRLLSINVALTVLTLVGVTLQWRHTPWLGLSLLSWTGACLLATWLIGQGQAPTTASYNPHTQRFTVPGSWVPLCLFMAIFACKFVVGMLNATTPSTLHTLNAAMGISALYGLFSGVLNGRARRLLELKDIA